MEGLSDETPEEEPPQPGALLLINSRRHRQARFEKEFGSKQVRILTTSVALVNVVFAVYLVIIRQSVEASYPFRMQGYGALWFLAVAAVLNTTAALLCWRFWWVRRGNTESQAEVSVRSTVLFQGNPTGYVPVEAVSSGSVIYAYMPYRNLPHLRLAQAMQEQGQAEVIVRLNTGDIAVTATGLTARSITLSAQ